MKKKIKARVTGYSFADPAKPVQVDPEGVRTSLFKITYEYELDGKIVCGEMEKSRLWKLYEHKYDDPQWETVLITIEDGLPKKGGLFSKLKK